MDGDDLKQLSAALDCLLSRDDFVRIVERLKVELAASDDTFVWTTVDLSAIPVPLPDEIASCWVFHLRGGVPSGSHRHPTSVQHMAVVSGSAIANIGGVSSPTVSFSSTVDPRNAWLVIGVDVCHEFTPLDSDMTVVSFHTVCVDELEEVSCETGESRIYEPV